MPVHGIAHYNLRLSRPLMEEVRRFYEQVVGLRTGPRPPFNSFGYWLYAGERDVLHLSEERHGDERRVGSDLSFDHVALSCSDWSATVSGLRVRAIPFTEDRVPASGQRQIFFRDPAGNGVELLFAAGDD